MDREMMNQVGASEGTYRDNLAHRNHDPYGGSDPYAINDPYADKDAHKKQENREKKKLWELDFAIVRFFRENYNAGIDFEESPRNFFDEEKMLSIRMSLLSRNFKIMIFKFLIMVVFSLSALMLTQNGVLIAGLIYLILFLYNIAVPMAFVKYTRQYIMVDDSKRGKLKKIHDTYSSWIRPLETITMNTYTIIFVLFELFLFFNINFIESQISVLSEFVNINLFSEYLLTVTSQSMQISILITTAFYIFSYLTYWLFIYRIWGPKWEKQRLENVKQWTRTNQRTANNLMDELTKEDEQ